MDISPPTQSDSTEIVGSGCKLLNCYIFALEFRSLENIDWEKFESYLVGIFKEAYLTREYA